MFMAWFTYDTERPPEDVTAMLGEPGHRWLTAQGAYENNVATLDVYVTSGGILDSAQPAPFTEQDGEITVEFNTCNSGTVAYDIPSIDRQGEVPIERIVLDNVSLCYLLDNQPVPVEISESGTEYLYLADFAAILPIDCQYLGYKASQDPFPQLTDRMASNSRWLFCQFLAVGTGC